VMIFELITGQTIEGRLRRFDRFAVVVDTGKTELLVYKHAISTITEAEQQPA
jgi:RNA chaperone Hfq